MLNYSKEKDRYLISLILVSLIFVLVYLKMGVRFETNDDGQIMSVLAGYYSGEPSVNMVFVNYIFAGIVSGLYRVFPKLAWYTILHVGMLWLANICICKTIMKICVRKSLPVYIPLFLYGVFYLIFLLYPTVCLQFTTTPAVLGGGSCLLLCEMSNTDSMKSKILDACLSIFFMFWAYIFRPWSGRVMLGYIIFSLICTILEKGLNYNISNRGILKIYLNNFIRPLLCCLIIFVLCGTSELINDIQRSNFEWKSFSEYHKARSNYTDYIKPSFEEDAEFYREAGFSAGLYTMVSNWFFMDERINKELFSNVVEKTNKTNRTFENALCNIKVYFKNVILKEGIVHVVSGGLLILFLWDFMLLLSCNDRKIFGLELLGTIIIFFILFFYLNYIGRLPDRAYNLISIPLSLFLIRMNLTNSAIETYCYIPRKLFAMCCILLFLLLFQKGYEKKYWENGYNNSAFANEVKKEIDLYAIENPDKIIIHSMELALNPAPLSVYDKDKTPHNLFFWGGSTMYSPAYSEKLKNNNLVSLFAKNFTDNNVYYMGVEGSQSLEILKAYLYEDYKIVNCRCVDEILMSDKRKICIYKFY